MLALISCGCQRSGDDIRVAASGVESEAAPDARFGSTLDRAMELLFDAPNRYQYRRAVEALVQVVSATPDDPKARLMPVSWLGRKGRYEQARSHLEAARVNDAQFEEPVFWRRVVEAFPGDRWAWYELASSDLVLEQFVDSAEAARQALLLEPGPSRWEASRINYLHSKALFRSGRFA